MDKNKSEQHTNELLIFTYKHRKPLLITGVLAGVISIVVSLMLPVLYESNAIVFPTATSTVSFNPLSNAKASSMDFGEEENAEQLIQILQSSPLRNKIISQFNLAEVYGLEEGEKSYYYKLGKEYNDHIHFERTRYGSINISVLDEEPQRAADIANKIVQLIDTVKNDLIKERTVPAFEINKRKLEQLKTAQEKLNQEMDSLSQLGVVNAKSRASLFAAFNESKTQEDKAFFKNQIEVNLKYGARYDALSDLREFRIEKMTDHEVSFEQSESDALENFNHKFVVESAVASDKKAKPKRMIIVLIATISAVIFMFIILLIRERFQSIQQSK
ncbi:hypothetical protein CW751_06735 [Brumimicrobium salinarum]|uniref:Polysaccharide chain length determinant N-terminal domain-containing protein n=1 Tax=Brumimicrobium salinarum TaxID=2058658 RepID=A0A2I0R2Q3_9FLAO|nr:hypothetical protein [Brumimicrobium salinarum]PKR80861.1 hypothetical protein CW751_06735 [Brumimicrobium salinarum]